LTGLFCREKKKRGPINCFVTKKASAAEILGRAIDNVYELEALSQVVHHGEKKSVCTLVSRGKDNAIRGGEKKRNIGGVDYTPFGKAAETGGLSCA